MSYFQINLIDPFIFYTHFTFNYYIVLTCEMWKVKYLCFQLFERTFVDITLFHIWLHQQTYKTICLSMHL